MTVRIQWDGHRRAHGVPVTQADIDMALACRAAYRMDVMTPKQALWLLDNIVSIDGWTPSWAKTVRIINEARDDHL